MTRHDYGPTGFTAAHLGHVELHRWYTPAGLVTAVRQLAAAGAPFVYAYYEGIDKVAHAAGLGPYYDDELRAVDRLVADVLDVLPPGAVLVVTADHGQVEVGGSVEVLGPEIMEAVTPDQWRGTLPLAARSPGRRRPTWRRRRAELYGDVAWVRTREQMIDDGLAGRRALADGGGAAGRRRPGAVRSDGLPRPGRHRRAAPQGPARVADLGGDAGSPARLAGPDGVGGWRRRATLGARRSRRGRRDGHETTGDGRHHG